MYHTGTGRDTKIFKNKYHKDPTQSEWTSCPGRMHSYGKHLVHHSLEPGGIGLNQFWFLWVTVVVDIPQRGMGRGRGEGELEVVDSRFASYFKM